MANVTNICLNNVYQFGVVYLADQVAFGDAMYALQSTSRILTRLDGQAIEG